MFGSIASAFGNFEAIIRKADACSDHSACTGIHSSTFANDIEEKVQRTGTRCELHTHFLWDWACVTEAYPGAAGTPPSL